MPQNPTEFKIIGNWKMHGLRADLEQLEAISTSAKASAQEVALCLPAQLLALAKNMAQNKSVMLGAQACDATEQGAQTGALSAKQLKDIGAELVLCGHSEVRAREHLSSHDVAKRAQAAVQAGLQVIVCIGESLATYEAGEATGFLTQQVQESLPQEARAQNCALAYEPIWAIGTGRTPTAQEITSIHAHLRSLTDLPLLYGGSVNGDNAQEILSLQNVNGVLVGGASLTAQKFTPIIQAADKVSAI